MYLVACILTSAPAKFTQPLRDSPQELRRHALDELGWGGEGVESEIGTGNSPLTNSRYDKLLLLRQDKLGRDLTAQTAKLSEAITAASQKVLDANTKYAVDHLKGFEQGKYAAATIQQAQQQLQQVEAAVLAVR